MLRKFRLTTHWQYVDSFHDAVTKAGYELDDYGWMRRGTNPYEETGASGRDIPEADRLAFVSLMFDDSEQTRENVIDRIRFSTQIPFEVGPCIVYLPDGLESRWYEMVWPLCTQLHEAEIKAYGPEATAEDLAMVQTLRKVLLPILDQGIKQSEVTMGEFQAKIGGLLGIDLDGLNTHETARMMLEAMEAPDSPEGLTE